jgi:hypothetical protein
MLNTWNKLRSWASFEIYSPLTLPWSWHVESGHCYKLARPSPTKHYVRSTLELTWHLESWFKCHFLPLQQNNTLNKLRQFILSHFWKLRPPDPTQQYVKHVKKIGILSHFVDFVTVLLKALRSTYEPTWHPESCSKSILYSSKINTLNIRMNKVEMLICLEKIHPLPFQFIHWTHEEKLHLESFCNLQPLDWPYKIKPFAYRESLHVASVLKFTLLNATKIIVEHFGILPTPWPYKSIHSTYGSSWHVDSFYWIYLPCPLQNILFNVWISMASWLMLKCSLPSPTTKPYIEHMKKRNLESFLKFTAHRPYKTTRWTYGEISHVEWCLGFPSLRPCRTNGLRYEETCHAESFLKSTSRRPYLASTPSTNEQTWHVESLLKIYSPVPYKNIRSKSFNKQTCLASWDVFNMSFSMQVRTLKIGTKLKR